MNVIAIKDDVSVKLKCGIDYIIEGMTFKVMNEKYLPVQTKDGVENVWNLSVEYDYEPIKKGEMKVWMNAY